MERPTRPWHGVSFRRGHIRRVMAPSNRARIIERTARPQFGMRVAFPWSSMDRTVIYCRLESPRAVPCRPAADAKWCRDQADLDIRQRRCRYLHRHCKLAEVDEPSEIGRQQSRRNRAHKDVSEDAAGEEVGFAGRS